MVGVPRYRCGLMKGRKLIYLKLWPRRGLKETNLFKGAIPVAVGAAQVLVAYELIYHKLWPRRDLKGNHYQIANLYKGAHMYLWWELPRCWWPRQLIYH